MESRTVLFPVRCLLLLGLVTACSSTSTANETSDNEVRINQIQVIGTHNSYHIAPNKPVMDAIAAKREASARSLDYTHRPLGEQFSRLGIRQVELDLFADPRGGLYAKPEAISTIKDAAPLSDPNGLLKQPGMKVLHVAGIDYRTTVLTLVEALQQVRGWLKAHPDSVPIMVMLELKRSPIGPEFTQPRPFGPAELDAVDAEILSVFQPEEIILPDDVRGDKETLREAILTDGWPKLDTARGKVIFAMDNEGALPAAYLKAHPALRNRVMFVSVPEDHPAAAFLKLNDPIKGFDRIQRVVKQGFLVRTRADSGTRESRINDATKRDRAFASGAQFVSTDYPEPDQRFSDYQVRFPGGQTARANPVNGSSLGDGEFDQVAASN